MKYIFAALIITVAGCTRESPTAEIASPAPPAKARLTGTLRWIGVSGRNGCIKEFRCWAGTCDHHKGILLESRIFGWKALIPGGALSFDSFKAFDGRPVEVDVEIFPGGPLPEIWQRPDGETHHPDMYRVLSIRATS